MQEDSFSKRATESPRPGGNSDRGADRRTVLRRRRSSPQGPECCPAPCSASGNSQALLDDIRSKSTQRSPCIAFQRTQQGLPDALTLWRNLHDFWNIPNLSRAITLRRIHASRGSGRKNWIHIGSHKRDRRIASDSLGRGKAAVGCKSQCAITFPGSPACRSTDPGALPNLIPLCGSPGSP